MPSPPLLLRRALSRRPLPPARRVRRHPVGYRRLAQGRYRFEVEAAAMDHSRRSRVALRVLSLPPGGRDPGLWPRERSRARLGERHALAQPSSVAVREMQRAMEERKEAWARQPRARPASRTGLSNRRVMAERERSRVIGARALVAIYDQRSFRSIGDEFLCELGVRRRLASQRRDPAWRDGSAESGPVGEKDSDLVPLVLRRRLLLAAAIIPCGYRRAACRSSSRC